MRHFLQIAHNVDVIPLRLDLARQPELWNRDTARTTVVNGPHRAVDDIWIRFRSPDQLISPASYAEPFSPVMYPAWAALPSLRPLVFSLMTRMQAVQLGIVLITRIPPGHQVEPHDDRGRWGAEFFNTKLYLPLQTSPGCINTCADDAVEMKAGDVWMFDNLLTHATINESHEDRMTLIVTMRCE